MPGATKDAADIVTKLSGSQVKLVPSESGDKADGAGTATETESTGKGSKLGTYEVIANGQVRFTPPSPISTWTSPWCSRPPTSRASRRSYSRACSAKLTARRSQRRP